MKAKPFEQLIGKSKGELFKDYPYSFDFSMPTDWFNVFWAWCSEKRPGITAGMILASTVWVYPPNGSLFGQPVTCCSEIEEALIATMGDGYDPHPERKIEQEQQIEADRKIEEQWENPNDDEGDK